MDLSFFKIAEEDARLHKIARDHFAQGNPIKALEVLEDVYSRRREDDVPGMIPFLQGCILYHLAKRAENSDMKFSFFLGCVEPFTQHFGIHAFAAESLFEIAKDLDSAFYYKKAAKHAREGLCLVESYDELDSLALQTKGTLANILNDAKSKIRHGCTGKSSETALVESKEARDTIRSCDSDNAEGKRLRSHWASMSVEAKKNFMKVSISRLKGYVERLHGEEGKDALEEVLDSTRTNKKWRFWMCRTCAQKFFYVKKFRNHIEQEHSAKFKPATRNLTPEMVNEAWAGMIFDGGWEPVDAVAAAEMIKTRLEFVKEFEYEEGWSKDWPLAEDEERSNLLKQIQYLLVSLWERKVLPFSTLEWMLQFPILSQFEVSVSLTTECGLLGMPQRICFWNCHELERILDLLRLFKFERDDGTNLVCRAVERLCGRTGVKEKIEFDDQFSFMLLDRRLLRGNIAPFDDEGTIDPCKYDYYAKTQPQGDDIITWLLDHPLIDGSFEFPRSIRAHNLDIIVAILRAIHYTCRDWGTKYARKLDNLCYYKFLTDAKDLCTSEDERRRTAPEGEGDVLYASLLGDMCEKLKTDNGGIEFVFAVRDILEKASLPTFDFDDLEASLNLIHGLKDLSDDEVLKSIDSLRFVVTNKVLLTDSKILLIENSRISLLNELTRLSAFDYRSYIRHLLRRFMRDELNEIVKMDALAKVAAAEADLLSSEKQEKEKKSGSKNKKRGVIKNELNEIVKMDALAKVAAAEADLLSSEKQEKEKKSGSKNKKRGVIKNELNEIVKMDALAKVAAAEADLLSNLQNMPGEDLLSKHMESPRVAAATRCNLALDMTLKALCKIKVLKEYLVLNQDEFADNQEGQVPYALRDFFTAVASKTIKEGMYSYLLGNVLSSLEEAHSMSRDAAELLVSILEFWPCWRTPDIESCVTHIFTLEEYERMSCSKCRKNPNYPEQSSYGVVVSADSIRDLRRAFGKMKLEDILKLIRMEYKMLCDAKTEGCGKANFVHHIISRCTPIFTIVLKWEKNETEKEIHETTKALHREIDISRLYEGMEPNTTYRLVSMVGCTCGEEEEYICLFFKKNRWVSYRHEALAKKAVGGWTNVVRFCEKMKVRPEILFYEAVPKLDQ
uniref:C2H2-type domain-containing protein n=1 Tax=Brassica campestris TaxID=3711 RepID=M4FGH1_BRACM